MSIHLNCTPHKPVITMLNLHLKISKASLWLGMMCFSFKLTFFSDFKISFSVKEWHESGHGSALSSHFHGAFDVSLKKNKSNISISINKLTVEMHFEITKRKSDTKRNMSSQFQRNSLTSWKIHFYKQLRYCNNSSQ